MSSRIGFTSIILSAILFVSCATDRIHYAGRPDQDCKTPETRYDYGEKTLAREIKSNSRNYSRYAYHVTRRKKQTYYSAFTPAEKNKNTETIIIRNRQLQYLPAGSNSGIIELTFSETLAESPVVTRFYYGLSEMPVPEISIIESPKIVITGTSEKLPSIFESSDSESEKAYVPSQMKAKNEVLPGAGFSDKTRGNPFHGNMDYILLMALMAGLIPFVAIKAKPRLANNISFWAAMNPWKTRFMFAGAQVALGTSGILLGGNLADYGMHFTDLSKDIILGAFLTSALFYPVRHASIGLLKHSYLRQKAFDLALAISGFLLMINVGNSNPDLAAGFERMVSFKANVDQNVKVINDQNQALKSLTYFNGEKELMVKQVIPQDNGTSTGVKVLLTVLTIIGALVLGYLLAAAACGLSCNGMEGLAYLVGIGGGILLITLAVLTIRKIWNRNGRKKAKHSGIPGSVPAEGTLQI